MAGNIASLPNRNRYRSRAGGKTLSFGARIRILAVLVSQLTHAPAFAEDPGRVLFDESECGSCHEFPLAPGQPVVPLRGLTSRFTAESLAAFLLAPPLPMPPFPELSEPERLTLARYLLADFP